MRPSLCVLLLVAACGASDSASDYMDDDYMDEDFPPWTCDTEGTTGACESTGDVAAPSCQGTDDCVGGVCAASFNGDIGPLECQSTCIEAMDDERWCSDAQACCDGTAICDRGYCVPTDGGSTGLDSTGTDGGVDSTGTDSTGTDSTGTDGGTSTDGSSTGSTGTGA